jgi:hypothetical protein
VNFVAGGAEGSLLRLVGSEGTLTLAGDALTVRRRPLPARPEYGDYDSLSTFPQSIQDEFVRQYNLKFYDVPRGVHEPSEMVYSAPDGYDDREDHWANLIAAVRSGKAIVEDATYGLKAAGPSLAANESYFTNRIVTWDPRKLEYS